MNEHVSICIEKLKIYKNSKCLAFFIIDIISCRHFEILQVFILLKVYVCLV